MLQQHSNRRRNTRIGLVVGAVALSLAAAPTFGSSSAAVRFGKPVIVDQQLAGGEPSVFWDPAHQDFIYSSHEGTTHTLRDGLASPSGDAGVAENYRNQVNIWTSRDGKKWVRTNLSGTGFEASPSNNTGFSDPDLTQDDGGRIYNTGIDLVNDALFSGTRERSTATTVTAPGSPAVRRTPSGSRTTPTPATTRSGSPPTRARRVAAPASSTRAATESCSTTR
jgi:hypothetical protein